DGVIRAKGEILDGLPEDGIAFLNRGAPGFVDLERRARGRRVVEFGEGARHFAPIEVRPSGAAAALRTADSPWLEVPLPARQAGNVLAAVAVARAMGMEWDAIAGRLRAFEPPPLRFRIDEIGGVTIVDDTYNASPISVRAAIEEVDARPVAGRRYLVLGDMRELGHSAARLHAEVGEAIVRSRFDEVVAVGSLAAIAADAVERCGRPVERVSAAEDIAERLAPRLRPGDAVLVKGSRAVGLDAAARALRARIAGKREGT
ncbi:MAG: UDP-N-acetylmuramoyl-tripeptide--D-alanyl-D-alanine ligase, partial [Planctomycetes bacterium]|nr:UDP-N-acetylmuramoyl-tripeptide--D-alanyl-D-alanine ligase [Planctomycetota bacterium]